MMLLEKLLGSTLVSRRSETSTREALAHKTVVGLYFTASTCRPCRAFTPVLATVYRNMTLNAYKSLPMKDQLDVVVLSMDRSPVAFHDALLQTPFLAVPFHRREVVQDMWKRYEVKTIPTLIFVDANGDVVEREGRRFVENSFTDLRKIWEHLAPSFPSSPGPETTMP
jgi:nucleoredoxin